MKVKIVLFLLLICRLSVSKHSELLVYDWSEEGDPEVVVEDIERIDFDKYDSQDPKMKDWKQYSEEDWAILRNRYVCIKIFYHLISFFDIQVRRWQGQPYVVF